MIKWIMGLSLALALFATACDKNDDSSNKCIAFTEYRVTVSDALYRTLMEQSAYAAQLYIVHSAEEFDDLFPDVQLPAVDFSKETLLVALDVNSCAYTKIVPTLYDLGKLGILLQCYVDDGGVRPDVISPWMVVLGVDSAVAERSIVLKVDRQRGREQ